MGRLKQPRGQRREQGGWGLGTRPGDSCGGGGGEGELVREVEMRGRVRHGNPAEDFRGEGGTRWKG